RIFKFLHLPVQSGSGTILQKMNRPNMSTNYIFLTNFLREKIPSLTLSTDIIVGFPSESDEEFQQTVELIRRSRPDIVHISKFKSRPGTKAEKMKELDPRTINERSELIHKVVKEIAFENNKRWVGWSGKVMVDEEVKGAVMARNFAYKPIIIKGKIPLGNTLSVEVIRSTSDCLYGEIRQTH
ncbi:MAG TPA: 2-methylthioadenine synthetase, partial [Nitrososphaerales archaeon]